MGTTSPKTADGPSSEAPAPAPTSAPATAPIAYKTYAKDCAVIAGDPFGPIIASGKALGPGLSKISARMVMFKAADTNPWMGFVLEFPLGETQANNEDTGFGVRHHCNFFPSIPYLIY
jgi:hypothetical protein